MPAVVGSRFLPPTHPELSLGISRELSLSATAMPRQAGARRGIARLRRQSAGADCVSFGESHELHSSSTWPETRPFVNEFFNFWLDGEDSLWAKIMWTGLEEAGLFSNSGTGLLWTRSNVAALSLIYAESVCRLGARPDRAL